jgi:hypothetical protein
MITIKEQKIEMKKALLKIYENKLDDMSFAVLQDEFDRMEGLLYPCFRVYIAGRKLQAESIEELRLLVAEEVIRLQNAIDFKWCDKDIYYKNECIGVMTNPFEEEA